MIGQQTRNSPYRMCIIAILLYVYLYFTRSVPPAFTLAFNSEFQLTAGQIGQLNGYYYYNFLLSLIIASVAIDSFKPKQTVLAGIIITLIANAFFTFSTTFSAALTSRMLLSFADTLISIGILKLGSMWLSARYYTYFVGFLMLSAGLTMIFSTHIVAPMLHSLTPFTTMLLIVSAGILLLVLAYTMLTNQTHEPDMNITLNLDSMAKTLKNVSFWHCAIISVIGFSFISLMSHVLIQELASRQINFIFAITLANLGFLSGITFFTALSGDFKQNKFILLFGLLFSAISLTVMIETSMPKLLVLTLIAMSGMGVGAVILSFAMINQYVSKNTIGFAYSLINFLLGISIFMSPSLLVKTIDLGEHAMVSCIIGVLLLALMLAAVLKKPVRTQEPPTPELRSNIRMDLIDAFTGKIPLGQTFWLVFHYGFMFTLVCALFALSFLRNIGVLNLTYLEVILFVLSLPYFLYAAMCVWQSANNYTGWYGWKILAKGYIIFELISFLALVYIQRS